MLADMRAQHERDLTDLRAQRDSWQQVAERLTLAPPTAKPPSVPTVLVTPRRAWWPWRRAG
jgi:hypothetical protein